METCFVIFSKEIFASNFSYFFCWIGMSFSLLHQVEEGKGEDEDGGNGGRALDVRETDWRNMLVVIMRL